MEIKVSVYREGRVIIRCPSLRVNREAYPSVFLIGKKSKLRAFRQYVMFEVLRKLLEDPQEEVEFSIFYGLLKTGLPQKFPTNFKSLMSLIERKDLVQLCILEGDVKFSEGPIIEKTLTVTLDSSDPLEWEFPSFSMTDLERFLRLWSEQNPINE
jgi:hypothetical protein